MQVEFTCSKERCIQGLWKHGRAVGLGRLHSHEPPNDTIVRQIIDAGFADYVQGKPFKINFDSWPYLTRTGYDRINGNGAMQYVATLLHNDNADLTGGETKELTASEQTALMANTDLHVE
jgi:hypothetical protein